MRRRPRLPGDHRRRVAQVVGGRLDHLVRRRPHQPRHAEQERDDGRADRAAQGARRLAAQLELPPQLLRVLYVLEGEEAQPDRRPERAEDGRHPHR